MSSADILTSAGPLIPGGTLASVAIDQPEGDDVSDLHPDERALAEAFGAGRRSAFVAGRRALRAALRQAVPDVADLPLLRTPRGAPHLPPGATGSISHKRTRAIALAAPSSVGLIGVDLELRPTERDAARPSIADRILTRQELDRLQPLDPLAHRETTLVYFALKEAIYKAIDPYVERYVLFTEVALDLHEDGRATVHLLLPEPAMQHVRVTAHWRFDEQWIIATARSTRE